MGSETPDEALEYEKSLQIAIDGEIVARLEAKPSELMSPLEDELVAEVLIETFSDVEEGDEEARAAIRKYDPDVQLYAPDDGEAEPDWTQPMPASELNLDLRE